jgi:hypothetical protein
VWTVITVAVFVLAFLVLMLVSSLEGGFPRWRSGGTLSGDEFREEHRHRSRRR